MSDQISLDQVARFLRGLDQGSAEAAKLASMAKSKAKKPDYPVSLGKEHKSARQLGQAILKKFNGRNRAFKCMIVVDTRNGTVNIHWRALHTGSRYQDKKDPDKVYASKAAAIWAEGDYIDSWYDAPDNSKAMPKADSMFLTSGDFQQIGKSSYQAALLDKGDNMVE